MTLSARDRSLIWHPFTQEQTAQLPITIKRGSGSYLYDDTGKSYLDLISSWWVNIHGHSNESIANAIHAQALSLEHIIFAGFTHKPAVTLCEKLKTILPSTLDKFFFSDNGSTAVEVALKMASQYWYNKNQKQRNIFLSFEGGYHGDTFGAMSVGCSSGFYKPFQKLLFEVIQIPYPASWDDDQDREAKEANALKVLKEQCEAYGDRISSIILEPLVQGAIGMRVCSANFLNQFLKIVKQYDILVIFDEVMTGFGRTGTYFASEQLDIEPDLICLSKALTGGFLPLALTVANNKIYNAFLSDEWDKAFAHGHSYTANPIACAAANMSFDILIQDHVKNSLLDIHQAHLNGIKVLQQDHLDKIHHTRVIGTISAFELRDTSYVKGVSASESLKIHCLKNGLLIRPLKNTIYIMPPYTITKAELEYSYSVINDALAQL